MKSMARTQNILLAMLVCMLCITCTPKAESNEIVFVCTHGAARSPIAAAYFNKLAKERGLNFHASFKGTKPDKTLTKETITGLTKDGFDITAWEPSNVSTSDFDNAYGLITFDCSVPVDQQLSLRQSWNGTPSISKDYKAARDNIRERVERLIDSLERE